MGNREDIANRDWAGKLADEKTTAREPGGWVKPRPQRSILELRQLIAEKEAELQALRDEVFNLENGPRLEAVAQIRNIMRAQQLTLADIAGRPEETLT